LNYIRTENVPAYSWESFIGMYIIINVTEDLRLTFFFLFSGIWWDNGSFSWRQLFDHH
jgi:hypothetical protein